MIPGLNTNITYGGIEYHVQTEDLGRENPCVLTLVFRAGAIIAREKANYREALGEAASGADIKSFMDQQHHRIIRGILTGQARGLAAAQPAEQPSSPAAPAPPKPTLPAADKSLDDLIQEYLRSRNAAKPR